MCRTYRDRADKHGDGSDKRDKKEAKTNSSANKEERKSTTVKQLDGDAADRDDDEYAFALRDKIYVLEHGEVISATVRGIEIDLLVDSGSRCNIMDENTWESLKSKVISSFRKNVFAVNEIL
ncbi:uncharacterized protein LOC112463439 [Temnothorax curvispinosus]|uniref:Uncharacterized protein LOC112463439 n=1 Tax=Temnothorax curvispinosus TaxID=300111 RepID=A0A6J1QXL7_9HYME|nr:uncharacterized protein LOC112463439 [Temnothorax curvispinosus]